MVIGGCKLQGRPLFPHKIIVCSGADDADLDVHGSVWMTDYTSHSNRQH